MIYHNTLRENHSHEMESKGKSCHIPTHLLPPYPQTKPDILVSGTLVKLQANIIESIQEANLDCNPPSANYERQNIKSFACPWLSGKSIH
mmetsp:Transcript_2813/g.4016  ORF Transcript_2813/g.4016 Transcript_2813/m.4016 type:complete len:90 (+) Transcript_2813:28-297(+)